MPKHSDETPKNGFSPFLKWPGGKRWLAPLLTPIIRRELKGLYYEPFVGGGAVFFNLKPERAVLSDINAELITALGTVCERTNDVIQKILTFANDKECYYRARSTKPRTAIMAAARFIYLNRTCWGGLYRLNRRGEFNVPFGNSGRPVCPVSAIRSCAGAFKNATLQCSDFGEVMLQAEKGDAIYADPPYSLRGKNNGFLRYNDKLFSWEDQKRLAKVSSRIARRGVFIVISGIWHEDLLSLYPGWWSLRLSRKSLVSGNVKGRRLISELLLFSKKPRSCILPIQRVPVKFGCGRDASCPAPPAQIRT